MRATAPAPHRRQRFAQLAPPLCGLLGLFWAYHPTLLSGFARLQTDPGDTRLNNYLLEHSLLWVTGAPLHRDYWSPPVFYPTPSTGAYTDLLLGLAPLYWLPRLLGAPPDTAFQLWTLALLALNYLLAYLFLRGLRIGGPLGAAFGAFLFAFGAPRTAQLAHIQLLPQLFVLAAWLALIRLAQQHDRRWTRRQPAGWIALLFGAAVLQLYTAFYTAWFLTLTLVLAVSWALLLPTYRRIGLAIVRQHWAALGLGGLLAALLALPLLLQYLDAARAVGVRSYAEVQPFLPSRWAWLYLGPTSWLYGGLAQLEPFKAMQYGYEKELGFGLVSAAAALLGLALERRRPGVGLLLLVAGSLMLLITILPRNVQLWELVHGFVPGASAVRAVSRAGVLLLLPAAIGLTFLLERLWSGPRPWLALMVGLVCILEQGRTTPSYDKAVIRGWVETIAQQIGPDCHSFLYTPRVSDPTPPIHRYQVDAMWAGLRRGLPTLNGYSGNTPPGWEFEIGTIRTRADERRLQEALERWRAVWSLKPDSVCQVQIAAPEYRSLLEVELLGAPPTRWRVSQSQSYSITVRNVGTDTWIATGPRAVYLAAFFGPNDIWCACGTDRQFPLPADLEPGASAVLTISLQAPATPGPNQLRHRLVKQGVAWSAELMRTDVQID